MGKSRENREKLRIRSIFWRKIGYFGANFRKNNYLKNLNNNNDNKLFEFLRVIRRRGYDVYKKNLGKKTEIFRTKIWKNSEYESGRGLKGTEI